MPSSDNIAPVPWKSRLATPFHVADWSQRRFLDGLALLPAVGLSLAFGAWRGDEAAGVMAAGGALARVEATLIGATVALAVHAIPLHRRVGATTAGVDTA